MWTTWRCCTPTWMEPGQGLPDAGAGGHGGRQPGQFSQLMGNIQTLDIPSDLLVSFVPAPELAQQTLGLISGMARAEGDADCLRDVDAWEATPQHAPRRAGARTVAGPGTTQPHAANLQPCHGCGRRRNGRVRHHLPAQQRGPGAMRAMHWHARPPRDRWSWNPALRLRSPRTPQAFSVVSPYQRIALRVATGGQCATSTGNLEGG